MRVNMNKIKVIISGESIAEGCNIAMWCLW